MVFVVGRIYERQELVAGSLDPRSASLVRLASFAVAVSGIGCSAWKLIVCS